MGKAIPTGNNADMVDVVAVNAEKDEVASFQVIFGHHNAEQGKLSGGTRENHPKMLFVEILHEPRTVKAVRGAPATAVGGAEEFINGGKKAIKRLL